MEKIALIVKIEFISESKAVFMDALLSHKERCLKNESGTLYFEIMCPVDNQNTVVLFELYANDNALTTHESGSSLALFKEQAGAFIKNASVQRCNAV